MIVHEHELLIQFDCDWLRALHHSHYPCNFILKTINVSFGKQFFGSASQFIFEIIGMSLGQFKNIEKYSLVRWYKKTEMAEIVFLIKAQSVAQLVSQPPKVVRR